MCPDPDALRGLMNRLEAAKVPDRDLDAALHWALVGRHLDTDPGLRPMFDRDAGSSWDRVLGRHWRDLDKPVPAYTTSLDAAVALVERCLPGTAWGVSVEPALQIEPPFDVKYHAFVAEHWPTKPPGRWNADSSYRAGAPLALCTAFCRALLARTETEKTDG